MKTTNSYKINHETKTITITKSFAIACSIINSKEYREFTSFKKDYPDYEVVRRTAKVRAKKQTHSGLTFNFMEKYLNTLENSAAAVKELEAVKAYYKGSPAYYAKVKNWFLTNHSDYENVEIVA